MSSSAPSSPELTVVTLTWNSERFIGAMLDSLLEDARVSSLAVQVIVVDNGSTDQTVGLVRARMEPKAAIELVELPYNQGTTRPRNLGIRRAKAEYVLILDSDTLIRPGALRGLLDSHERIPTQSGRIGIVHPKLVYSDGVVQESARRFPTLFTKGYRLLKWESMRRRDESIPAVLAGRVTKVDYAISAAWLVKRALFEKVGMLDETIFYSPEDVEFCARCWRAGFEVWYYPDVTIVHDCQRITAKRPLSKLGLSHVKGLVMFWRQYGMFSPRKHRRDGDEESQ